MTYASWALAAASLVGVWLNIRKDRRCFSLWLVTNTSWAAVDFHAGLHAQGALMSIYAAMAAWGWLAWSPTTNQTA